MPDGEFSVSQFFALHDAWEYVARFVDAKTAVETAKEYTDRPAALIGIVCRIIITDGGDFTVFEWKFGEGVTYPPHDGTKYVAEEKA